MKLWQKIVVTIVAMLIVSYGGARLWLLAFDFVIPSYLAGMIGGLTAIPVWEFLRWINAKSP